jgi:hypothetical protein
MHSHSILINSLTRNLSFVASQNPDHLEEDIFVFNRAMINF